MEKPKLVIDKDQKKVYLDGEVVGEMTNDNYIEEGEFELQVNFNNLYKLSYFCLNNIYENNFTAIRVGLNNEVFPYSNWLDRVTFYFSKAGFVHLYVFIKIEYWNHTFGFKLFFDKLRSNLKNDQLVSLTSVNINEALVASLIFELRFIEELKDFQSLCDSVLTILKSRLNMALLELSHNERINQPNLSKTFTFPPEIQSACRQYLQYFAEFLKDIGINAETNIESKAHETLFTVIPESGEEALDKIKEALQVYLMLPESPEFESVAAEFTDVGVHQLVSQVHFLRSQLALGKSMIQMKDATIETLRLTNYQQKEIIQSHQKEVKNEEELAGGLIKATEVKVKGFTFDLPELLRRIKRKFK